MRTFTEKEARDIGVRLNIDWATVKFGVEDFRVGLGVESKEHNDITRGNPILIGKIALAHLKERPDYYPKLAQMEKEPVTENKKIRVGRGRLRKIVEHLVKQTIKVESMTTASIAGVQTPQKKTTKKDLKKTVQETVNRVLGEGKEYIISPKTETLGIPMDTMVSFEMLEGETVLFNLRGAPLFGYGKYPDEDVVKDPEGAKERKGSIDLLKKILDVLEANGVIKDAKIYYETFKWDIEGKGFLRIDTKLSEQEMIRILNRGGLWTRPYREQEYEKWISQFGYDREKDSDYEDYYNAYVKATQKKKS